MTVSLSDTPQGRRGRGPVDALYAKGPDAYRGRQRPVDDNHRTTWSNFDWFAIEDDGFSDATAFSNVMGKYVVAGTVTARVRRLDARNADKNYVEYIYAVDSRTGAPTARACIR
ncbi:hypothetical protein [Kribbella sp. CA-294648]|uniref:hypothetical protein n=1 Tax=Kribbella sp. CA-294648 TaxID=3239948 RepID=UPI003D8BCEF9